MPLIHFFEIKKETVWRMCDENNPIKIIELLGDILSVIIILQKNNNTGFKCDDQTGYDSQSCNYVSNQVNKERWSI